MNTDFRPPRTNRAVVGAVYPLVPSLLRYARQVHRVEVEPEEWERLYALRRRRFVLTPNHPSSTDPLIALWMARRLGCSFNYLACRELFQGPYGWLLQRLGCYSILRGTLDREAVRTTIALLAERDRQVVIFPEGEIYGHNDMLLPFQSGVVQLGFMAADRLAKEGREPSLPVVPAVVKYLHLEDARPAIRTGLEQLEWALGLPGPAPESDYLRLRRAGEATLAAVEREYRLGPPPEATPDDRVQAVKQEILRRVAAAVGVEPPGGTFAEGLHELLHRTHEFGAEFGDGESRYQRRLHRRRLTATLPLYQDLWRLQNMVAVSDGYVAAHMTGERFVEVLNRIEVEVTGRVRTLVPSRAVIRVLPPLELGERHDAYRSSKREVIAATTRELEGRMRALMEEMAKWGTRLH